MGTQPRTRIVHVGDYQQTWRNLEECEKYKHPAGTLLAFVLRDKIMATDPVSNVYVSDQVIGGSCVASSVDC